MLDLRAGLLALSAPGALLFLLVTVPQYGGIVEEAGPLTLMAVCLVAAVFGWLGIRQWRTSSS